MGDEGQNVTTDASFSRQPKGSLALTGNEIFEKTAYYMRMDKTSLAKLLLTLALTAPSLVQAGTWGVGKWGQMYWGSNPETAPIVAPSVNAQGNGTDITFTLTNLLTGQEVGWSAITQFEVTCGNQPAVLVSADNPKLTNLDPGTEYTCTIIALNEPNGQTGRSPAGTFTATTDSLGGLPVWLLYQATQQS